MTREQFEAKLIRQGERALGIPSGWWGTRANFRSPYGVRVVRSGSLWAVLVNSSVVARGTHNQAIRRARREDAKRKRELVVVPLPFKRRSA